MFRFICKQTLLVVWVQWTGGLSGIPNHHISCPALVKTALKMTKLTPMALISSTVLIYISIYSLFALEMKVVTYSAWLGEVQSQGTELKQF